MTRILMTNRQSHWVIQSDDGDWNHKRQRYSNEWTFFIMWIHFSEHSLSSVVMHNHKNITCSSSKLIELHPEWKSDVRVTLFCSYLHNPMLCEDSFETLNGWLQDHLNNQCVFSYEGITRIQNSMLQVCSDYYSKENYSLCAIVGMKRWLHVQWCKRTMPIITQDIMKADLLCLWSFCQYQLREYVSLIHDLQNSPLQKNWSHNQCNSIQQRKYIHNTSLKQRVYSSSSELNWKQVLFVPVWWVNHRK